MYHEINDEIKLDFGMPDVLRNLLQEAEEADIRNDGSYINLADTIDVVCKNLCSDGKITKEQWNLVIRRYPEW